MKEKISFPIDPYKLKRIINPIEPCGIYFLFLNNQLIYIGKSITIYTRITAHRSNKRLKKTFDSFSFIEISKEKLTEMERKYIEYFKPKTNKHNIIKPSKNKRDILKKFLNYKKENNLDFTVLVNDIQKITGIKIPVETFYRAKHKKNWNPRYRLFTAIKLFCDFKNL